MPEMLNSDLRWFINSYVDSLLAWDIILFLYYNPDKTAGVDELAGRFGRTDEEVERVFKHFRRERLVEKVILGPEAYGYSATRYFQQKVRPFIAALNKRQQRLAILAEVLKRTYAI